MQKKVFADIQRNFDKSIESLSNALKIPSVSATNLSLDECANYIADEMKGIGLDVELLPGAPAPIVYSKYFESSNYPTILFYNHYDVQPPDPLALWESPPFNPTIRDGRLFSRGANDNKGNLFSRIFAVKALLQASDGDLGVNIKFIAEGMEESGSRGFSEVIEKNKRIYDADLCIWESGSADRNNLVIVLGFKGILTCTITAYGPKSDLHSSLGVIIPNPAWRLVKFLSSLKDEQGNIIISGFYDEIIPYSEEMKRCIDDSKFDKKEIEEKVGINLNNENSNEELKHTYYFSPALNINGLKSGYQGEGHKTVLPSTAMAKIDFRLVPGQDSKDIIKKLEAYKNKLGFNDIKISNVESYNASITSPDNPVIKNVVEAANEVYDNVLIEQISPASSPAFAISKYIPVVSFGIGDSLANIHSPNESISLEHYLLGQKMVANMLLKFR